ncbi:MAG: hypothetical protein WBO10_07365 [Pyrinomonadaceae bacterium]
MGVLLMLMTIGGLVAAGILLAISLFSKKAWLTKFTLGGVAVWLVFYVAMLFGFSLISTEKVLAVDEPKEFCGFYFDCHMHTAVKAVRTTKIVGDQTAKGEFYIVTVQVFSDARSPSIGLRLTDPMAVVVDTNGNSFPRSKDAEKALPTADVDLGQSVWNEKPLEKEIVFDLPVDFQNPRLDVREGLGIDKVIEAVLIGDEDSLFHKRTYFKLESATSTAS